MLVLGAVKPESSTDPSVSSSSSHVDELARFGALLDPLRVGLTLRCVADDKIVLWNHGAEEIYGWTQSEAIGKPMHALLRTRFTGARADVDNVLRRDGRWEGDLTQVRRDGEMVVVASHQVVRQDESDDRQTVLAVDVDITNRKQIESDLRSSEDRLHSLVSSIKDYAIYRLSPNGIVMSWNEGAQQLKGYRREEIIGQHFSRFFTPEDVDRGLPGWLLDRAATDGRVAAQGWRARKDGSRFWADIVLTALRDEDGELWGFAKVTRDLTERMEAEEARARASREEGARLAAEAAQAELRTSRDQLAAILAGVGEGITVQERSGRLIYANDAAAALSGFPDAAAMLAASPQEIVSRFEILDETGAPFALDRLPGRLLFQGQPAVETLVQFRTAARKMIRWSVINATPIRDEAGEVQLVVNIFHDITDRRRAEETARFLAAASVELTRSLDGDVTLQKIAQLAVPSLADWCLIDVLDENGQPRRLAMVNADSARARLAEEVAKRFPIDLTTPTAIPRVLRTGQAELISEIADAQLLATIDNPDLLAIVQSLQLRSGMIVPLIARGRTVGAITLVQAESGRRYGPEDLDAAQRLALHAALAIDNARLYREAQQQADTHVKLNDALNEAMSQLQDTLRTRDDFLAAASHDLKNPLTSIKGTAQLLQRRVDRTGEVDPDQLRTSLARIDAVTSRAVDLLDELLDVARLHTGRPLELDRQHFDLVALARDIVDEHQQRSEFHQIRVECLAPDLVGAWDRRRLSRVVGNLLDNALKYSTAGGEIRVRIAREDGLEPRAVLAVDDNGVGIPPEDLPRIFERFHRGSNVSGQIPGTGIGLASARHIVESHGGTIAAASQVNHGASFTIRLPLADPSTRPRMEPPPG